MKNSDEECIDYRTVAIEVGLVFFYFVLIFSSTYFLFRLEQTHYKAIDMILLLTIHQY
jgi:hypothetical protein